MHITKVHLRILIYCITRLPQKILVAYTALLLQHHIHYCTQCEDTTTTTEMHDITNNDISVQPIALILMSQHIFYWCNGNIQIITINVTMQLLGMMAVINMISY